jgi:hypothetical protein
MITHIPVRIDNHLFILSIEDGRAQSVSRARSSGDIELLWVPPAQPVTDARDVLETAGFSITSPHGRTTNV